MAIVTDKLISVRTTSGRLPQRNASPGGQAWQREMRDAIRDAGQLCKILKLPAKLADSSAAEAAKKFPVFVPIPFLSRIEPANLHDPLLKQVLPLAAEQDLVAGFSADPVSDQAAEKAPGLIQKYHGRVLLIAAKACAVHCRYCFRREFPYDTSPTSFDDWKPALSWIANNDSIEEVILSGGDPLTLVDARLKQLVDQISRIKHVQRLRIHSRLPVMIPSRINDEIVTLLKSTRLVSVFVAHSNHANEWDQAAGQAIGRLVDSGIPVLNQSVLLRGVNDSVEALVDLSKRLINLRVMPYYLNQLDRVNGAAHFEVPLETGQQLVERMRRFLPGYAVPKYVVDDGSLDSKSNIGS